MLLLFVLLLVPGPLAWSAVDFRFVAPGAQVIASVKVPQLLRSAAGPEAREWVVDAFYGCPMAESIANSMRRIQFSAVQVGAEAERKTEWLIELDGVWAWWAVQDCLRREGYAEAAYRGVPLMPPAAEHRMGATAAFYGGEMVLLGDGGAVRSALDRALDNTNGESALMHKAQELDEQWDAWVTGEGSPLNFNGKTRKEVVEGLPRPRTYWLGISGVDVFSLELRMDMMNAEEAALVLRILQFLPQFARIRPAERKMQTELFEHLRAEAAGATVRLSAQVPGHVLWSNFGPLVEGTAARSKFGRQRSRGSGR